MTRTVLTIGTFDCPHLGHAILLKECEKFGDVVLVGVNSDEFVEFYKGKSPIYSYKERSSLIRSLGYDVRINETAGRDLIQKICPNVLAIGSDWARKDYYKQIDVDQDFMDEHRIAMLYIPRVGTLSSTELKERAK